MRRIDMQKAILSIYGLTKKYKDFTLDNISFTVPHDFIVGLIGENGADKSTVIKAIKDVIKCDSGNVTMFDGNGDISTAEKSRLAVVFDGSNFPDILTVRTLNNVLKNIYPNWNEEKYFSKITELSPAKAL